VVVIVRRLRIGVCSFLFNLAGTSHHVDGFRRERFGERDDLYLFGGSKLVGMETDFSLHHDLLLLLGLDDFLIKLAFRLHRLIRRLSVHFLVVVSEQLFFCLVVFLLVLDLFVDLVDFFDEPENLVVFPFLLLGYLIVLFGFK